MLVTTRALAVVALGTIALTGTAVAGLEAALTPAPNALNSPARAAPAEAPAPGAAADEEPARAPCAPPVRVCVEVSGSTAWLLGDDGAALGPIPLGPIPVHAGDAGLPLGVFPVETRHLTYIEETSGRTMPFAILFADGRVLYQPDAAPPAPGSVQLPHGLGEKIFHAVSVGDLIEVVP